MSAHARVYALEAQLSESSQEAGEDTATLSDFCLFKDPNLWSKNVTNSTYQICVLFVILSFEVSQKLAKYMPKYLYEV